MPPLPQVVTAQEMELADNIEQLVGAGYREMAFTGAYDGAAQFDKQITGWHPPVQSADADMLPQKYVLDGRTRDMARNDAYVQGGEQMHKDSIVGSMYLLNAKPNIEILGWTEEQAEAFQKEVEAKFQTWAESPHKWVTADRQHDLTSLIRLAVGVYVFGGEFLATAEWINTTRREFKTALQLIDPDRLKTPMEEANNHRVRGGIKHDAFGRQMAAYILKRHPRDHQPSIPVINDLTDFNTVGFEKPWGRKQVLFIKNQRRIAQSRAVSEMVAGLRELAITRKFRDVTLQNAVVNATYAASIESELPSEVVYQQLGGGNVSDQITDYATDYLTAVSAYLSSANNMKIDGVKVPHLFPGTKLNMQPVGTPGGVGQEFEQSLLRYLAASLNVSYEELSRDYTRTTYSSARAAMTQTWRFMQSRKKEVADEIANCLYRLWMEEAINNDRLTTFPASQADQLYTEGHQNMMFDALTRADWIGASRGQIDELKETQAATLRIKYGLSTHEDELARLGKDWRKVYAQLAREVKLREELDIVLVEDNQMNATTGDPRESETGGEKDANSPDAGE